MFSRMSHYMDNFLFKSLSGFRKGYNTQYCLLKMFQKWKQAFDKGKSFIALLTNYLRLLIVFLMIFCLQNCMLMDLAFPKEKKLKLIQHIVLGKRYSLGYHKDLS